VKRLFIDVAIGVGVVLLVMMAEALVQTLRLPYSVWTFAVFVAEVALA